MTRQPDVEPLENADQVSDELLEDLWRQVETLHAAGISHGRLNASNILVVDGRPMLVDLSAATLGAPQSALDIDVAELLVACTVLVGPERALDTAVDAGRSETVARVLPYLQRAALTPHLRDLARSHEVGLKALRAAAATATGTRACSAPSNAAARFRGHRRRRVRGLPAHQSARADRVRHDRARASSGRRGLDRRGSDPRPAHIRLGRDLVSGCGCHPLALLPCVALESAIKFINLTVPSSAGRIGINIRFLQRMGTQTGEAVAGGAVDDLSDTIVEIALVLLTLPFVDLAINKGDLKLSAPSGRLITSVVLVLVAIVAVVLSVPAIRTKLLPSLRGALAGFRTVVGDRKKRLELFGGSIGSECLFALTLGAASLAYGVDLTFAQLLLVNTAASAFAGLIPTPGGVGAAEATLTAGLVAMGVDNSTAFAIAFTHRICTYYLPPIWGYLSLQWLRRRGYV